MMTRLSRRTQVLMTKASIWLPVEEYHAINRKKGDISASLFIRRAIQNALLEGRAANSYPNQLAPNATTLPPHQVTNSAEVQVS